MRTPKKRKSPTPALPDPSPDHYEAEQPAPSRKKPRRSDLPGDDDDFDVTLVAYPGGLAGSLKPDGKAKKKKKAKAKPRKSKDAAVDAEADRNVADNLDTTVAPETVNTTIEPGSSSQSLPSRGNGDDNDDAPFPPPKKKRSSKKSRASNVILSDAEGEGDDGGATESPVERNSKSKAKAQGEETQLNEGEQNENIAPLKPKKPRKSKAKVIEDENAALLEDSSVLAPTEQAEKEVSHTGICLF